MTNQFAAALERVAQANQRLAAFAGAGALTDEQVHAIAGAFASIAGRLEALLMDLGADRDRA